MSEIQKTELVIDDLRTPLRMCTPAGQMQAKEIVVFVHGNPGSGQDFVGLLPHVGDLAWAVAPDMPGYGKAERPKNFDYTVEGYGRHLGKLLDELGIERVHLVLHDFGGAWGLFWASEHKQRLASLTLINVGAMPGYTWHKFAKIWRTPILGEIFQYGATRGLFRMLLNRDNPKPFPDSFVDRMFDDADWGTKRAVLKLYRATDDLGGLTASFADVLQPLAIPTLVLWGDSDAYLPASYAYKQKEYFDAEVHVLPGCGHWPMIDEPRTVHDLLVRFLKKQTGNS